MVRLLKESAVLSQLDPTPSLLCEAPFGPSAAAAAAAAAALPVLAPWRGEPGRDRLTLPHSLDVLWRGASAAPGSPSSPS
jgi:hypothetical protein